MRTLDISPLEDRLSDGFLLDIFDTTMTNWKRNSNRRHHRTQLPPFPPPHMFERQRFPPNGHPRAQNQRAAPYQIRARQIPQHDSRSRHVGRPPGITTTPPTMQRNDNPSTVENGLSHPSPPPVPARPEIPLPISKPSSSSSSPHETTSKKTSTPPPSGKPTTTPKESWKIQLCLEKERLLIPQESKPSALLFFTDDIAQLTRESKSDPRILTKVYRPTDLFGTAPPRKVHLREISVTFPQIWSRHTFLQKWTRQGQDAEGYLKFEDKELKIQVQRHHVPGTLFTATDAGDFDINDDSITPPDVSYRLVDAAGQEFFRLESVYDLKRIVKVEDSEREVTFEGIDGKEIKVDIAGTNHVRITGAGMPRNPEGGNRGDVVVEVIRSQ